jgi:hypothetical protein
MSYAAPVTEWSTQNGCQGADHSSDHSSQEGSVLDTINNTGHECVGSFGLTFILFLTHFFSRLIV